MLEYKVVGSFQVSSTEFIFPRLPLIKCSCPNVSLSGERAVKGRTGQPCTAICRPNG